MLSSDCRPRRSGAPRVARRSAALACGRPRPERRSGERHGRPKSGRRPAGAMRLSSSLASFAKRRADCRINYPSRGHDPNVAGPRNRSAWLAGASDEVGNLLCGGSLHSGEHVNVLLHGELRRGVTKPLAHDPDPYASCKAEGGVSVAQVVKPDPWQTRSSDEPVEPLGEEVRVNTSPVIIGED